MKPENVEVSVDREKSEESQENISADGSSEAKENTPNTSRGNFEVPSKRSGTKITKSSLLQLPQFRYVTWRRLLCNVKKKKRKSYTRETRNENVHPPVVESNWTSEIDLIINCIGFSVGLGNLWRFPYYAQTYGAGAFLVPYILLTVIVSIPIYYLEIFVGQFSKLGPVRVWSFCPFFEGLGISLLLGTAVVQLYYNVIMSYALYYTVQAFQNRLPWANCEDWWGADEKCYLIFSRKVTCLANPENEHECIANASETSADQFWRKYVLGLSTGVYDIGTVKWEQALYLLATWVVVVVLAISRHHVTYRPQLQTVYVTAFFPFVILAVYFSYLLTFRGAVDGLLLLIIPDWQAILNTEVYPAL